MNSSGINKTDINMSVKIAGVEWKNPVTVASGTFGSGAEYSEFVDLNKLGAVTTKGVADKPWEGNPTPRVAEVYGGMLNAVGLQNPGIELFCKRDIPFLKKYDTKIVVNVRRHLRRSLYRISLRKGYLSCKKALFPDSGGLPHLTFLHILLQLSV